jgi:hypothetical protein
MSGQPRPFYPRRKSHRYPLDRILGEPPEPVWTIWRKENSWPYWDSNSGPRSPTLRPVAIPTTLNRLFLLSGVFEILLFPIDPAHSRKKKKNKNMKRIWFAGNRNGIYSVVLPKLKPRHTRFYNSHILPISRSGSGKPGTKKGSEYDLRFGRHSLQTGLSSLPTKLYKFHTRGVSNFFLLNGKISPRTNYKSTNLYLTIQAERLCCACTLF